ISQCYIASAGLPNTTMNEIAPRIATKYPNIAMKYYKGLGEQVEIIELNGSIELAPMIGLADRIVDIVSTGRTLKENGLVEYEHIADVSSRLIANPVSYRMKSDRIQDLVSRLKKCVN
ncbi:MAG: ATP phosphoribosyltransferase, partial [Lysinibacillus sp.]